AQSPFVRTLSGCREQWAGMRVHNVSCCPVSFRRHLRQPSGKLFPTCGFRRTSSTQIHFRYFFIRGAPMPILSSERSLFPDNLLEDFTSLPSEQRWWAIYTRSRMEKSLARELSDMDIPFYLPLIPQTRRVAGRPTKSLLPLFTGYLFTFCSDSQRV